MEAAIALAPIANHVPHLLLRYDQRYIKIKPSDVAEQLRQGEPSIELNPATGGGVENSGLPVDENTIVVGVWTLQPGEDLIVAERLKNILLKFT
jgi:L-seryl-tRNA(Ser) seleniumtransferase